MSEPSRVASESLQAAEPVSAPSIEHVEAVTSAERPVEAGVDHADSKDVQTAANEPPDVSALSLSHEPSAVAQSEASQPRPDDVAPVEVSAEQPAQSTAPAPSTEHPTHDPPAPAQLPAEAPEEQWPLKEVSWPPVSTPDAPSRRRLIVLQNANGPCRWLRGLHARD